MIAMMPSLTSEPFKMSTCSADSRPVKNLFFFFFFFFFKGTDVAMLKIANRVKIVPHGGSV